MAKKAAATTEPPSSKPATKPRMQVKYEQEILPNLSKEFGRENRLSLPRLQKIVINMGLGEAISNNKVLEIAADEMAAIAGQKPAITKSKKAISNFKLRENMPIGVMVTLRRRNMWEFLDRLNNIALPRVRDFKGVSDRGFDGRGNYTMGLKEQIIFPEIDYDKVDKVRGMNISFVTTAKNDVHGKALLTALGIPFVRRGDQQGQATA